MLSEWASYLGGLGPTQLDLLGTILGSGSRALSKRHPTLRRYRPSITTCPLQSKSSQQHVDMHNSKVEKETVP
jgi:hypothetical protein